MTQADTHRSGKGFEVRQQGAGESVKALLHSLCPARLFRKVIHGKPRNPNTRTQRHLSTSKTNEKPGMEIKIGFLVSFVSNSLFFFNAGFIIFVFRFFTSSDSCFN